MSSNDVIVVGGGFAGVAAARELHACGFRPILLEARERLGGKTWTSEFSGEQVEIGGTWIHWDQPHVWAEIARYGLEVAEEPKRESVYVYSSAEGPRRVEEKEIGAKREVLFSRYVDVARPVLDRPYEPLRHKDSIAELDALSLRDRLDDLDLDPSDIDWMREFLSRNAGGSIEDRSFFHLARWFALGGWSYERLSAAMHGIRLADGMATLIEAMARTFADDIHLAAPVDSIHIEDSFVTATTRNGESYAAPAAVVAVPVNVWPGISFSPPLSAARMRVSEEGVSAPVLTKVFARVKGDLENLAVILPGTAPIQSLWTFLRLEDSQVLYGLSIDPTLDATDHTQIERIVRDALPERCEILEVAGYEWGRDAFSRGTHAFFRPMQVSRYLHELQTPEGRLAFATSDLANGWAGFIDGAIESGIRAARQIREVMTDLRRR